MFFIEIVDGVFINAEQIEIIRSSKVGISFRLKGESDFRLVHDAYSKSFYDSITRLNTNEGCSMVLLLENCQRD